jgi:antirestriction protein
MTTIEKVIAARIDGYEPEADYDGYEQIQIESLRAFWSYQPGYWETQDAEDVLEAYDEAYQGYWESDEEFAQQLADDLGCINPEVEWPNSCIDWECAARELMMDYYEIESYYFRSM